METLTLSRNAVQIVNGVATISVGTEADADLLAGESEALLEALELPDDCRTVQIRLREGEVLHSFPVGRVKVSQYAAFSRA